jgi:hypothetical protein
MRTASVRPLPSAGHLHARVRVSAAGVAAARGRGLPVAAGAVGVSDASQECENHGAHQLCERLHLRVGPAATSAAAWRGARRSGEHGVRSCARGVGWRELSHALCAVQGARRFTEAGEEDVAHVADAGADDGQVLSPHAAQGGAV